MKTVARNRNTGRFGIYEVTGDGDNRTLGALVYEFSAGTTNGEACAAFDKYMATGELP